MSRKERLLSMIKKAQPRPGVSAPDTEQRRQEYRKRLRRAQEGYKE